MFIASNKKPHALRQERDVLTDMSLLRSDKRVGTCGL